MYPILYRKKTRTSFLACLLLLALTIRVLGEPELRGMVWARTKAVLGSEALFRTVLFLETGVLPEKLSAPVQLPPAGNEPAPERGNPSAAAASQTEDTQTPATAAPTPFTTEAVPAAVAPQPAPFTAAEAEALSLRGNCTYPVDKAALLLRPLNWPELPGPKVLILHSHSCEAYTQCDGHSYLPSDNYRTLDLSNNVTAVGDALAEALADLGVELIHDRSYNDYPSYNASYGVAREKIQAYLEQYPSIVLVLDLHRDALEKPVRETVERDGQTLAPLMLAVGSDQGGLNHPHWEDNLSCGLKLQALGCRDEPCLFKKLSFRKERFNGDLSPGALIVEVGSTENTLEEAQASMPYLARYLAELLRCP